MAAKDPAEFMESLNSQDPEKAMIIQELREIARSINPALEERVMYNGIVVYCDRNAVCGFFPRKQHVTVELERGVELEDDSGELEGSGVNRRHIKVRSALEIRERNVEGWLVRAFEINASP